MPPDRSADDSAITRRRLLQAGAAVGLAGGLGALSGSPFGGAANAAGEDFDYVVIGTGPGGAPVAANLAEAGFKVLALEAGPPHGNQNYYRAPILQARTEEDPAISWAFFVKHYTDIAAHGDSFKADKGGVFYPRASTLGGCMAHHFNIITYGEHSDWESLRQLTGDQGFHPDRMWEHWERVRKWQPLENIVPLALATDLPLVSLIAAAQLERLSLPAGKPAIGLSPNDRINVDRMAQGVYLTPQGTRRGVRVGPRERLLAVAQRHSNLTIVTNALAERIVFERGPGGKRKAVAVDYLEGEHLYAASPLYRRRTRAERRSIRRSVRVRREVIVAGGAFNSPQLLMLSGIGPKAHLERHGISVNVDLPGVGANLQDRVETAVISQFEQEWSVGDGCMFDDHDDPCFTRWNNAPNKSLELYSSNGVVGWIKRRYSKGPARPELVIFGGPLYFKYFEPGFSNTIAGRPFSHSTWAILKAYASGRAGSVRLRSKDPTAVPAINKRSLDDNTPGTYDVAALMEGVEVARRINSRVPFPHKEVFPGPGVTDMDLHIRRNQFGHHASCTNAIGSASDRRAVLDGRLRVRGTTNVRVVDASAFPSIPGVFIAVPIMVLFEKASRDILADAS